VDGVGKWYAMQRGRRRAKHSPESSESATAPAAVTTGTPRKQQQMRPLQTQRPRGTKMWLQQSNSDTRSKGNKKTCKGPPISGARNQPKHNNVLTLRTPEGSRQGFPHTAAAKTTKDCKKKCEKLGRPSGVRRNSTMQQTSKQGKAAATYLSS
jgi:hypothetical protein